MEVKIKIRLHIMKSIQVGLTLHQPYTSKMLPQKNYKSKWEKLRITICRRMIETAREFFNCWVNTSSLYHLSLPCTCQVPGLWSWAAEWGTALPSLSLFHSHSLSFLYLRWSCRFAIKSHLESGCLACRGQRGSLQLLWSSFGWVFLLLFIRILKAIFRKMGDLRRKETQQS